MKRPFLAAALSMLAVAHGAAAQSPMTSPAAPEWAKDLIVYEIATKSFTSPAGPGTGNFRSLRERLPYLQDLGITGIWLTGHSLSDPRHFYNIWTQYAVIEPDRLDPSLGTQADFKAMIDDAHRRGIKVFLDVITHGVMPGSPLVRRHPHWFRGGSWGMVDFDWQGGHTDLDDWWVKTWTDYVVRYGIDGFRLDVSIYRPDLWARIRRNAAAGGHPIVIFNEGLPVIPNVTDFTQAANAMVHYLTGDIAADVRSDVPALYRRMQEVGQGDFSADVEFADGTKQSYRTSADGQGKLLRRGFTTDRLSVQDRRPYGLSELWLAFDAGTGRTIKKVDVGLFDAQGRRTRSWTSEKSSLHTEYTGDRVEVAGIGARTALFLGPFHSDSPSIQLTSHDNGWEGAPATENPFGAEGRRSIMGYAFLLRPGIPLFMSGEEFDAGFHALPTLSPNLFGGGNPGQGRWLYGAQLDWSELARPRHRAMLDDVKRMIAIRKAQSAILTPPLGRAWEPDLVAVPHRANIEVPRPYMSWRGDTGIVVLGNADLRSDAIVTLALPLDRLGSVDGSQYRVTDLWNGGKPRRYSAAQLARLAVKVKRDRQPQGGLAVLKVQRISQAATGIDDR